MPASFHKEPTPCRQVGERGSSSYFSWGLGPGTTGDSTGGIFNLNVFPAGRALANQHFPKLHSCQWFSNLGAWEGSATEPSGGAEQT